MIVTIANSYKSVNFRHSTMNSYDLDNYVEYWFKLRTNFYLPIASIKNVTHFVLVLGQNTCG